MTIDWRDDRRDRDPETPFVVPRVGMRVVLRNGPSRTPGIIRAILDEGELGAVLVVRYWWKHKRCYHYKAHGQYEWELGIVYARPKKAKPGG